MFKQTDIPTDWSSWTSRGNSIQPISYLEPKRVEDSLRPTTLLPDNLPHRPAEHLGIKKKSRSSFRNAEYKKIWARNNEGITYKRRIGRRVPNLVWGMATGLVMACFAVTLLVMTYF